MLLKLINQTDEILPVPGPVSLQLAPHEVRMVEATCVHRMKLDRVRGLVWEVVAPLPRRSELPSKPQSGTLDPEVGEATSDKKKGASSAAAAPKKADKRKVKNNG